MLRLQTALLGCWCLCAHAAIARGQEAVPPLGRGPEFLAGGDGSHTAHVVSVHDMPILRRTVTLQVDSAPLPDVLRSIADQTGIRFAYSEAIVATDRKVALHVERISVGAALYELLLDSNLNVWVMPDDVLSLVSRTSPTEKQHEALFAAIAGVVSDRASGSPLELAALSLIDATTNRSVASRQTGLDGRYRFDRVKFGQYRLLVRRLGYVAATHTVSVNDTATNRIDIALVKSALTMDQVVITRTGDQDKGSVGSYISTIPADSVSALQPVQQVSDVFNARAAGVQVFSVGGLTGQAPQINIRGQNSATLSNQPIMYVDGVRIDNSYGQDQKTGRYNDILPSEIESIQVIRGPSAASLYGTDAATGIILITTKKGVAGSPKWNLTAENGSISVDKGRFQESYFPWGHAPGGGAEGQCTVVSVGGGQCVIDSITRYTPWLDPAQTPFGTGYRQNYIAQVSGGSPAVRYFSSVATEFETGYLKLPQAERASVEASPGGLTAVSRPNVLQKVGLRQTASAALSSKADLSFALGYIDNRNRIPTAGAISNGQIGPGYRDANDGWAFGLTPASMFEQRTLDHAQHLTTSGTLNWRPLTSIDAHATVGIDHTNDSYEQLVYAGEGPYYLGGQGSDLQSAIAGDVYTLDAGGTHTASLGSHVTFRTSVGTEYTRQISSNLSAFGQGLVPACGRVSCATLTTGSSVPSEVAILGGYGEEQVSLNDRLFVSGGARVDGSNAFGSSYRAAVYPKAHISWVTSSEAFWPRQPLVTALRLRAAYGQSGTQPSPQQALTTYQYIQTFVDGAPVLGAYPTQIGNSGLRPERQREYEFGGDADLLFGRLHGEFTYYDKLSSDALVTVTLGSSIGAPQETENIGSVRNQGIEAALSATVIDSRAVHVDVGMNASLNRNMLVSLGRGVQAQYNGFGSGSFVPGYPLFGIFDHRYQYADANHNGIIEPSELSIDSAQSFLGSSYPRSQLTFTASMSAFQGHIRFNAQVDHRDGFVLGNTDESARCYFGYCAATANVHSPLSTQAAAVAWSTAFDMTGYETNGSFTRLRELALTAVLPDGFAHTLRSRTVELTLAARNLALWTNFRGVDPETSTSVNLQTQANGAYNAGGMPLPTYWILRVNLGL